MRFSSGLSAALLLIAGSKAQETGSINTETITDATAAPQTPSTVPVATTVVASNTPVSSQSNPVVAADVMTTAGAPSVTATDISSGIVLPTMVAAVAAQDLFVQIASDDPATVLKSTYNHPVTPIGVSSEYSGSSGLPIATNNYYGNLMVGDRTNPAYVMPYSVYWRPGSGLCAWNTDSTQYVFGTYTAESTPGPHYYYSPVGNCPIGFSSAEMTSSQTMTASEIDHQSVDLVFTPGSGSGTMTIPLVQGNAFLTSIYKGLTPTLFGGAFTSITGVTFKSGNADAYGSKYRVTINNGDTWLVYVFPSTKGADTTMTLTTTTTLTGPANFNGVVQIAKLPLSYSTSDETIYDSAAGTYATQNVISGTASGSSGTYSFDFGAVSIAGNPLLSFLFPHQVTSVSSGTATSLKLWSNVKGQMQAYLGSVLSFTESDMPIDIQFLPWSPLGNLQNYSVAALKAIATAANAESAEVMSTQTNLNSMYYSGKALAKFAKLCLTINDVLDEDASACVAELEQSIAVFVNNQNIYPIVYDTAWKGAISSCGDQGCDFGNAWYNDHHFHYGYFVYTAAVIAHIDPSWLTTKNKAYINTLIRDFANPSTADKAFPQFRSFDWYAGHSWAHGLAPAGDGKDEESSSEDYNAIYGMKLWGHVIGDASMEARGNLMLAVMRRSMQSHMLMSSDNTVQPKAFVPQFAAGITFMNKVDHTTYFGQQEQFIQGIHMIPLTPISAYIRTPAFVAEEWSAVIEPILNDATDGFRGILMSNLAIANATASFEFFSSSDFKTDYLDSGASLAWYLTYAAGLGGAGDFELVVDTNNGKATTVSMSNAPAKTSSALVSTSSPTVTGTAINVAETSSSSSMSMQISSSSVVVASTTALPASTSDLTSTAPQISSSSLASTITAAPLATTTELLPSTTTSSVSSIIAEPSTLVQLSLGSLQVSCPEGKLVVGQSADVITVYDNGTLACGGLNAFLYSRSLLAYSIDLSKTRGIDALGSNFSIDGTTLLAFLDSTNLAKRQNTGTTQQQLAFAYGSDNVVMAVLPGSNTTMTTAVPQVLAVDPVTTTAVAPTTSTAAIVPSISSVAISSVATAAVDTSAAASSASAVGSTAPTASSIPVTASSALTVMTSAAAQAPTASTASAAPAAPAASSMTASIAALPTQQSSQTVVLVAPTGAPGVGSTGTSGSSGSSGQAGSGGVSGSSGSNGASGQPGSGGVSGQENQVSTTVTYTTTIGGVATVITTVVPVQTVIVTKMYTSTVCAQCTAATGVPSVPGSSGSGSVSGSSNNAGTGSSSTSSTSGSDSSSDNSSSTSSTSASSSDESTSDGSKSGTSASSGSSTTSNDNEVDGVAVNNAVANAAGSNSYTTIQSSTKAAALPTSSSTGLPVSTNGSGKLVASLTTLLGLSIVYFI